VTPARILVVDDDPSVLKVVQTVLSAEGYEVEVAADGPEALRRILESPPALVILDVMMPGLNGWELCEIVRRQSHTREVPVLFLTGARVDVQDQITALQVGGSDHMKKPFRAEELRAKARALTRRPVGERGR
jgi:DNA-binding response OmpR family regulator